MYSTDSLSLSFALAGLCHVRKQGEAVGFDLNQLGDCYQ